MQTNTDPPTKPISVSEESTTKLFDTSSAAAPNEAVYKALLSYPFDTDAEFQAGLSSILGHPGVPVTQDETNSKPDLVLRAQCFFYSRKFGLHTINPEEYKSWKAQQSGTNKNAVTSTNTVSTASTLADKPDEIAPTTTTEVAEQPPATTNTTATEPPPYPTSFAAIVDLITNNKPIPGIQEIPDTVLQHGSSKRDTATRRRKPWEKEEEPKSSDEAPLTATSTSVTAAAAATTSTNDNTSTSLRPETTIMPPTTTTPSSPEAKGTTTITTIAAAAASSSSPSVEDDIASAVDQFETQIETMERARRTGVGVMHILSPDAVPDSGLIAK